MEGGCGVADQLAASAQPPCARGGARQPGSINRGVLQIRPGAPNGTKVGVRRGLGAPHRRRPARGCSWSAAPRLAGSSTPPEQEAAVEITARKSRGGALLHPHTHTELPCSSASGHAPRQGVGRVSASPILRSESIAVLSCTNAKPTPRQLSAPVDCKPAALHPITTPCRREIDRPVWAMIVRFAFQHRRLSDEANLRCLIALNLLKEEKCLLA